MQTHLWPELPYDAWQDTYATLHMWTQVVGKIALHHGPIENHSWGFAMQVTPRGLATKTLHHGTRPFSFEFDFQDHRLILTVADAAQVVLKLVPMAVADFYDTVMTMCREAGLPVRVWTLPVEVEDPIPFEQDSIHASYDREAVQRVHQVLVQIDRVFRLHRTSFVGKSSPVHFFWGAFDLAVTRFSGRTAPPREGPAFMREAYSHEVISHGFWPGGRAMPMPVFYAYAVPEPEGLRSAEISPAAAYYHQPLGEFILPYDAVRTAADPQREILSFMDITYTHAATLAGWDRLALERRSEVI